MTCVKMIQRLDQPDAPHLKNIIRAFASVWKTLNHTENETKVSHNELFPQLPVS